MNINMSAALRPARAKHLIIGAAGAIGKALIQYLAPKPNINIVVALRRTPLPEHLAGLPTFTRKNIDVRDPDSLRAVFAEHVGLEGITHVWNLAAPLSVETAKDPAVAEAVGAGGGREVLGDRAVTRTSMKERCF